jgi:hypothetical protein
MRTRLVSILALAVGVSFATAANAATYTFTGKFTASRGLLINTPVVGNTPCPSISIMSGPGGMVVPAPVTPPMRTMTRMANATVLNVKDLGCVAAVPGKLINTTGMGVGGAFVMPPHVFSKPFPSYVAAVSVMYAPPILQLATSARVTAPPAVRTTPPAGTMRTGMNTAAFNAFKAGAWMTQTGRIGSMFTWCFGNPACTKITQGARPLIMKYQGGVNAFGGTMAYLAYAGANASSLAIGQAGAVGFARLTVVGSQPTGRGYADYLTDMLAAGPLWMMYKLGTVTRPIVGMQKLITMVTGYLGPLFPGQVNYNYGFPFTTGTVLARNTGTALGNPAIATISANGSDVLTGMGGRNISLVAGALAATSTGQNTPTLLQMKLSLPEPSGALQLFAGALGMLAIAWWRKRSSR